MQDVIGDEDWQKRKKIPVCPSCTLHKQKRNKKGTKNTKHCTCTSIHGNSVAVPRAGRNLKNGSPDGR